MPNSALTLCCRRLFFFNILLDLEKDVLLRRSFSLFSFAVVLLRDVSSDVESEDLVRARFFHAFLKLQMARIEETSSLIPNECY